MEVCCSERKLVCGRALVIDRLIEILQGSSLVSCIMYYVIYITSLKIP